MDRTTSLKPIVYSKEFETRKNYFRQNKDNLESLNNFIETLNKKGICLEDGLQNTEIFLKIYDELPHENPLKILIGYDGKDFRLKFKNITEEKRACIIFSRLKTMAPPYNYYFLHPLLTLNPDTTDSILDHMSPEDHKNLFFVDRKTKQYIKLYKIKNKKSLQIPSDKPLIKTLSQWLSVGGGNHWLEELDVSDHKLDAEELDFIFSNFHSLNSLKIKSNNLSASHSKTNMENIITLSLDNLPENPNQILSNLEKFKNLKHLKFFDWLEKKDLGSRITSYFNPIAWESLSRLTNIETLTFSCCSISDKDLESLGSLKKLKHLEVDGSNELDGHQYIWGFEYINQWPNLESLILNCYRIRDNDFVNMKECHGLKLLHCNNFDTWPDITKDQVEKFAAKFPNLESLKFDNIHKDAFIHLKGFKQLKELRLRCSAKNSDGDGLEYLNQMPNLESLTLRNANITYSDFQTLTVYPNLKSLKLDNRSETSYFQVTKLGDIFPNLESLSLSLFLIPLGLSNAPDLKNLEKLTELKLTAKHHVNQNKIYLNIGGLTCDTKWETSVESLTLQGFWIDYLGRLKDCSRLKVLKLNFCELQRTQELPDMSQFPRLEFLELIQVEHPQLNQELIDTWKSHNPRLKIVFEPSVGRWLKIDN